MIFSDKKPMVLCFRYQERIWAFEIFYLQDTKFNIYIYSFREPENLIQVKFYRKSDAPNKEDISLEEVLFY